MSASPQALTPLALELQRLLQTDGNAFSPPADVLVVRGARPFPYGPDNGDKTSWRRIERPFGRFDRSLRVPPGLDPDAIAVTLRDGVLTLRIPKPEERKPRRIEIAEATG